MKKQKIDLEVESYQNMVAGTDNQLKFNESGFLYHKNNYYYLVYQDHSEGINGARTMFKIDVREKKIFLLRSKPAKMRQVFKNGETLQGFYDTDYGKMKLESETKDLSLKIDKLEGFIKINYNLYINGSLSTKNRLKMVYRKRERDNCDKKYES